MRRILAAASLIVAIVPDALAQGSRTELDQITAQLAQKPADAALRDKVIKLALSLNPPPAVPEEARRFFVRGNTFLQDAKRPRDYDLALAQYAESLRRAPWFADAYFNQAKAFELRTRYAEAIAALRWYLMAAPGAADARAAQDKIYALEAKADAAKRAPAAAPPSAATTRPSAPMKPQARPAVRTIEGAWRWLDIQINIAKAAGGYSVTGLPYDQIVTSTGDNHVTTRKTVGHIRMLGSCTLSSDGNTINCQNTVQNLESNESGPTNPTQWTRIR